MRLSNQYLAGLFDGEGSIGLYKSSRPRKRPNRSPTLRFSLSVIICNAHLGIIKELKRIFGGDIQKSKGSSLERPVWTWRRQGKYAIPFLQAIQSHSIIKKPQIDLALEYEEKYEDDGGGKPWQPIERRRETIADKIRYIEKFSKGTIADRLVSSNTTWYVSGGFREVNRGIKRMD